MATDSNNALHAEQKNEAANMEIETNEQSEGQSDSELKFVNQGKSMSETLCMPASAACY